ncbi:MAG: hypothetical protein FJZ01_08700 [Candidatus Sericytochromatia bacterium]|nr:hypothetical protein [Candidatus Tanganyikabacteria bacterium]
MPMPQRDPYSREVVDAKLDAVRADIRALDVKIDGLEKRVDAKIDGLEKRVDAKIDGLEKRVDAKIDGLDRKSDGLDCKFETKIDALRAEMVSGFARVEGIMRSEIGRLDTKIDAKVDGLRCEMRIWLLVLGFLVSPIMTSIGIRTAAAVWPAPPPASLGR